MTEPWHERIVRVLKAHEIRLVTYIPDNVLSPLIEALHADSHYGSLLMQFGALGTVAATAPGNLAIVAFDNGM